MPKEGGWFSSLASMASKVLPPPLSIAASAAGAIARAVTGDDESADMESVIAKIQGNPELQAQMVQALANKEIELARIDSVNLRADLDASQRQLETVNASYQEELKNSDPFVRRWRPMFGYIVGGAWGLQALGIFAVFIGTIFIEDVLRVAALYDGLTKALSALGMQWGVALAVLGVNVSKRSKDKQTAVGLAPQGLIGMAAGAIGNILKK